MRESEQREFDPLNSEVNDESELKPIDDELEVLKLVMQTKAGRSFVWRILGESRVFCTSFAGSDTHVMAFNEGRKQIGYKLFAQLQSMPKKYELMKKEQVNG